MHKNGASGTKLIVQHSLRLLFYLNSSAAKHRRRQIRAILRASMMSFDLSLIVALPPFYTCV